MLQEVFRTKEGKIIGAILGFILIIIGIVAIKNYSESKQFAQQAVMAENYLEAGNYEQAIQAYLKAMSMQNSDQQLLSIGLADAYVGMKEYDKALEVLRACYKKTSGTKIKEKIEAVISEKTDYEYLQSISRAEVYFSNKEYDKAITEYEKAKLIKSKEVTSYQRIAEAFIEIGEYTLARDEVIEGSAITQNKELDKTLEVVDTYLLKEQYKAMVSQAEEYIYQENYEDGIVKYKEAIALLPTESMAYLGLAEEYLANGDYDSIIFLLSSAVKLVQSDDLEDLLSQARQLKEKEVERETILSTLYEALKERSLTKINAIINLKSFKENIAPNSPLYYGFREDAPSDRTGLVIYDEKRIYFGEIRDGSKNGNGIYYMLTKNDQEQGFYFYDGVWKNDIPSGRGKTVKEESLLNSDGVPYISKTVTEGIFNKALENGNMVKYFYVDQKEEGNVSYKAQNGIPLPLTSRDNQPIPSPEAERYVIGIIYLDNVPTGKYFSVDPQTVWGVEPFMKKN